MFPIRVGMLTEDHQATTDELEIKSPIKSAELLRDRSTSDVF